MNDLDARMKEARGALEAPWDEARAAKAYAGMRARGRRRAAARSVPAVLAACAAAALFAWRVRAPRVSPDPVLTAFEQGTTARALSPDAVLRVREQSAAAVTVDLERGAAVFRVARRDGGRVFRVHAGSVDVQVLGTEFTVTRDGDGARVRVAEGRVRVFFAGRYEDLGAGESWDSAGAAAVASAPVVTRETRPTAEEPPAAPASSSVSTARTSLDALQARAEQAERAGDTAGAVRHWRALVEREPHGERAQQALEAIGRAQDGAAAARTFERAFAAAPRGSRAEDVLRDAATRWLQAGDEGAARRVARLYQGSFPTGTHIARMRTLAATEE
jgi:hypothetical protein